MARSGSKLFSSIPMALKLRARIYGSADPANSWVRAKVAPMLRFADLEQDMDLLDAARGVADELLCNIRNWQNVTLSDGWEEKANTCRYES